jgi:hypothetical protein
MGSFLQTVSYEIDNGWHDHGFLEGAARRGSPTGTTEHLVQVSDSDFLTGSG